jgi:hypothetical protein
VEEEMGVVALAREAAGRTVAVEGIIAFVVDIVAVEHTMVVEVQAAH